MPNLNKIVSTLLLSIILLGAAEKQTPIHPYKGKDTKNAKLLETRFKLNLDPVDAQNNIHKSDRYKKIINETLNLSFLQEPVVKTIKPFDTIYVHPEFITTIVLPKSFKITYAKPSFKASTFHHDENIILLQTEKNHIIGNIVIASSNQDTSNYIQQINIKKIEVSDIQNSNVMLDAQYSKYLVKNNYLSTMYKYRIAEPLEPIAVIEEYKQLNSLTNKQLWSVFKENGDFDVVLIGGDTPYYVIRDSNNYDIEYAGIKFRMASSYNIGVASQKSKGVTRR